MKKIIISVLVAMGLSAPVLAYAGALPFMIVRFNQPNVYFDGALSQAVQSALQAKPDAHFTLVSFAPVRQPVEEAAKHINAVSYVIRAVGVPDSHIHVQRNLNDSLQFDEIHILVE